MAEEAIKLDKIFIKNKIQDVLNKTHKNPQKRIIKDFPERFNMACPVCGDSQSVASKKRGNLYFKNLMYICYNCDYHSSFIKLCELYNIEIDIEKRLDMYNYIDNNTYYKYQDNDYAISNLDKLIDINKLINFYNTNPEHKLTNIKPLQKNSAVYQYLTLERKIYNDQNLYEANYHFTDKWVEPVVVIFNKHQDFVIGMQIRNLKEDKKKRFYKIYEFQDIYDLMYPDKKLDEFEMIAYNKLSHFYNIFNVDFTKEVTIFEGYLDSHFFPNSIGVVGVNTDLSFLLKNKSLNLRFFYDNDKDGYKASVEKLNDGYKVFLWRYLFAKILKNKSDKYSAQKRLNNIKDLNKLAIECNRPPYDLLQLEECFSKDSFDLYYLDNTIPLINLI